MSNITVVVNQSPVRYGIGIDIELALVARALKLEEHEFVANHATVEDVSAAIVKHRDHATTRVDLYFESVEEVAFVAFANKQLLTTIKLIPWLLTQG